jgi:hypothetical protein
MHHDSEHSKWNDLSLDQTIDKIDDEATRVALKKINEAIFYKVKKPLVENISSLNKEIKQLKHKNASLESELARIK